MNRKFNFLKGNPDNLLSLSFSPTANSLGYRAPEFDTVDWTNSVVMFGCSNVFGTGLTDEETIPSQLENLIERPVINMGVPASSVVHSFVNQLLCIEQGILPYAVVNVWTNTKRLSYFLDNNIAIHVGPWVEKKDEVGLDFRLYKKLFELWNFEDSNPEIYCSIFQRTARILWKDTRYLEYSFFQQTADRLNVNFIKRTDYGSDNAHPGPQTAFNAAKRIAEDLERR